jgi:hypothetical protein
LAHEPGHEEVRHRRVGAIAHALCELRDLREALMKYRGRCVVELAQEDRLVAGFMQSPQKLAVIARDGDVDAMLCHALIQGA